MHSGTAFGKHVYKRLCLPLSGGLIVGNGAVCTGRKNVELITHSKHAVNIAVWERGVSLAAGGLFTIAGIRTGMGRDWSRGIASALFGAELIRRGVSGHSHMYELFGFRTAPLGQGAETTSVPYELGLRVDRAITINRPRPEVYRFFRNLSNLPRFTQHVQSVAEIDAVRSHWVVKGPAGRSVEWDAVIHNVQENELIAWRTLPGAHVDHAGSVLFRDAPAGRGTEVKVELQYNPPAGLAGAVLSRLWGEEPTQQIQDDLHRLKQILEIGEVVTTQGQSSGRHLPLPGEALLSRMETVVELASEASFPASDAPSYTG
jgi:uncharacterized membrane protein